VSDPAEQGRPAAATVAVAIPCYNEGAAIARVVADFRQALATARILVLDNNSTDATAEEARAAGAEVVPVADQGKGHAVRAAFAALAEADIVVLVDGDGTYPAAAAPLLVEPVRLGKADMVVARREPVAEPGAMSPVRGFGNLLLRAAFRVLIGRAPGDLLSGYRVFSREFREAVSLESCGFEIEAELSSEAVGLGLRVAEVPVPYLPRAEGTVSKLRAVRDGTRILRMIGLQSLRLRPWRPVLIASAVLGGVSLPARFLPGIACAVALAIEAGVLWVIHLRRG
jgi:hypothetical protein